MSRTPRHTPGPLALRRVLRESRITQAACARQLGVTPQAVGLWVGGLARPSLTHCLALHQLYGIPVGAWAVTA